MDHTLTREHIPTEHPALAIYRNMISSFNHDVVLDFAFDLDFAFNRAFAADNLDAVFQWLACQAVREQTAGPYVMMRGPVNDMYHALILNTSHYERLCDTYFGSPLHYTPVNATQAQAIKRAGGISYTIDCLREAFGHELSPALQLWIAEYQSGNIIASAISCGSNDADITSNILLGISDFRDFWECTPQALGTA